MKRSGFTLIRYFAKNISIVIGLVLVWRGIWYVLDYIDLAVFNGQHIFTAIGGIALGLLILYIPDKDLKELEKL
jgi:membrane associated rhomboid family serine protease